MSNTPPPVSSILEELDKNQRKAASAERNAVVSAGAGSGKTKTLAARYAYLVIEKGLKPENILTLTFTKKAAAEMYTRIYKILSEHRDNERAAAALREFGKARIGTIDSFCSAVTRASSRLWGISPEFTTDDASLRELAKSAALSFVLEHRENPALAAILSRYNIQDTGEKLFANIVVEHSPLSAPIDFNAALEKQKETVSKELLSCGAKIENAVSEIKAVFSEFNKSDTQYYKKWKTALETEPSFPDFTRLFSQDGRGEDVQRYFKWFFAVCKIGLPGNCKEPLASVKEIHKMMREELEKPLGSLANTALQWETVSGIFALLSRFQEEFNRKKREAGILSFVDVARAACDTLRNDTALRAYYKRRIRAIMIDEFQDNNSLQRDLVFLLAEKDAVCKAGVPSAEDLDEGKLFFVGDEKQSIYRFRGADVSVFRSLARSLSQNAEEAAELSLSYNYRSHPSLIDAFNRIFENVFLPKQDSDFEARYSEIAIPENRQNEERLPRVHFAFLDTAKVTKDSGLSSSALEAAYIADKIRSMIDSGFEVTDKTAEGGKRKCRAADFAVLQRSYTHQAALEREFKRRGLQFASSSPKGLFQDAPVNDLLSFLRLAVYPNDRLSYAAALRSPFVRLSGDGLLRCLTGGGAIFDETTEMPLSEDDKLRFARGRALYEKLRSAASPVTETLCDIWYFEGYREETLWSAEAAIYAELFDMLFDIARLCDERGLGLSGFVDHLENLIADPSLLDIGESADAGDDEGGGVKLLSIHASKGMEFPVVFIFRGSAHSNGKDNGSLVCFNREYGPTLNLPQAEALPESFGNYFYTREKEAEKAQEKAELRRLLYVAMTRAECALFFTASLPPQTKDEKALMDMENEEYNAGYIQTRLDLLFQINLEKEKTRTAFLDLLLPVLAKTEDMYALEDCSREFTIENIPVYTWEELSGLSGLLQKKSGADQFTKAEYAMSFYQAAPLRGTGPLIPEVLSASKMQPEVPRAEEAGGDDPIYSLLRKASLTPADFGTITHALIEAGLKNTPPRLPAKVTGSIDENTKAALDESARLAELFLTSDLGKAALASPLCESEFSIVTLWEQEGESIPVDGSIDLLFEQGDGIVVVDFKTDRVENPAEHETQLEVYKQAGADIFGKPVRGFIYYLRTGHTVEV